MSVPLNVKIGLDSSDVTPAVAQFMQALGQSADAIDNLLITGQKFNQQGKVVAGGIEVQVDAYRKLEFQLKSLTKTQAQAFDAQARGVALTTKQAKAIQDLVLIQNQGFAGGQGALKAPSLITSSAAPPPLADQNLQNAASGTAAQERLRNLFPAPSNANLQQISKYESAINRVGQLISSGKVSSSRFEELFTAFQGKGKLGNLSGDEQKLITALGSIGKGFQTAEKDANSFHLTARTAFRIGEALILKEAVGQLVQQLQKATIEAVQFQIRISEIRTISQGNQSSFEAWGKSIREVSDALGLPQADVAEAAYQAISNQVTKGKEETEAFLKATGEFARTGVAKISDAAELTSSAINAYGFTLDKTEQIQAKFFKAVELGRFRVSDLANDFGRLAAPAAAIGISFEEVLGGIAALTNQGVKANDAQTQLLNIVLKLEKPSKRMKDLLDSWGTSTGQAAIGTFGFTGVLQKLENAAKGDVEVLAELGGELRAIRGLTGLATGGKGDQFRSYTDQIKNDSQQSYENAKVIRAESAGDRLTKEMNRVKNFFIDDLGQSVLTSIDQINDHLKNNTGGFVDLAKSVQVGAVAVLDIIKIWAAYKVSATAVSLSTRLVGGAHAALTPLVYGYTAAQKAAIASEEARIASMTRTERAAIGFQSALSGLVKVVTFAVILDQIADMVKQFDEANKKSKEFENQLRKIESLRQGKTETGESTSDAIFAKGQQQQTEGFAKEVDAYFQPVLNAQSVLIQNSQGELAKIRDDAKQAADAISASFSTVTDKIKNTIGEYGKNITQAKDEIKKSQKEILNLSDTTDGLILKLKQKFANPNQQFILRDQEINGLLNKVREMYAKATPESIEEARKLAKKLQEVVFEDEEARQQNYVDRVKAQREQQYLMSGKKYADNSPIDVFLGNSVERLRDIENITKSWEMRSQRILDNTVKQNESLKEQEKTHERVLEKAIKEFMAVDPYTKSGAPKPEYTDKTTGKLDTQKVIDDYTKQAGKVLALTKNTQEFDEVLNAIEQKRALLIKETNKERDIAILKEKQLALVQEKDKYNKDFSKASNSRVQTRKEVDSLAGQIAGTVDVLGLIGERVKKDSSFATIGDGEKNPVLKLGEQFSQLIVDGINKIPGGRQLSVSERDTILKQNEELFKEVLNANNALKEATNKLVARDERGNFTATPKDISAFNDAKFNALSLNNQLIGKFTGQGNNDNFAPPGGATLGEAGKMLNELRDKIVGGLDSDKQFSVMQDNLRTSLQGFARDHGQAVQNNVSALDRNTTNIDKLIGQLQQQNMNIPAQQPGFNGLNGLAIPNFNPFGGFFHDGGLIKGPSGYDNLNIRAEAGEFIVNQRATKKWMPQLLAMNRGGSPKIPGHYHEGGFVQTNVGDVNVTITGQASPQSTIRQMGQALRREIRRGNLNLGK